MYMNMYYAYYCMCHCYNRPWTGIAIHVLIHATPLPAIRYMERYKLIFCSSTSICFSFYDNILWIENNTELYMNMHRSSQA